MKNLTMTMLSALLLTAGAYAQDKPLTGTFIGSAPADDFYKAFDGNFDTFFASDARSYTYVGLDLGTPHVITRIGYAPRTDNPGPQRLQLGVFEGANSPDFMDAVPIYIIHDNSASARKMTYADVECSRGFRYVRYVGPSDERCNIAELEFYGEEGEGDDSHLYQLTNIPTVVINTVDAVAPYDKEHNIESRIKIISDSGTKILDATATTRLRGNASMEFPKKPYRIKFDKKQKVLDAPAKAKKWTLINNYGDKTLLRNDIAFETARRLGMEYVPFLASVDVILNGEYKGNYQLCDQIEVNSGRVDIEEMEPADNEGEALTGGYLLEVDGYATGEPVWFLSNRNIPVTVKSPDDDEITPEQLAYITDYFNSMEESLWETTSGADRSCAYREMFDVRSFFQHFLVGEISCNTDTYWSTYMYKRRGNPLIYTGPVWDFDIAFDNDIRTYPLSNYSGWLSMSGKSSAAGKMRDFVNRVLNWDPESKGVVRSLWEDAAANHDLTAESLNEYIDLRADEIDASQQLNFKRWPILWDRVHVNPVALGSYRGEVDRVKSYLSSRMANITDFVSRYPQPSGMEGADLESGRVTVVGGEIFASEFGADSCYALYDTAGRMIAGGSFTGTQRIAIPATGLYILTVTDGETGTTLSRKIAY